MIYNFGVAKCLLDHGLHKVQPERQSIIGSSAGSLAAAGLVLEADIDKVRHEIHTVSSQGEGFTIAPFFVAYQNLSEANAQTSVGMNGIRLVYIRQIEPFFCWQALGPSTHPDVQQFKYVVVQRNQVHTYVRGTACSTRI